MGISLGLLPTTLPSVVRERLNFTYTCCLSTKSVKIHNKRMNVIITNSACFSSSDLTGDGLFLSDDNLR